MIFAPYETYLDDLLGVKTSYGASVMIRNEAESKKLAVFQKYVPELQEALPLAQRICLPSAASNRRWKWWMRPIARAICCTDIRPSRTIFPTIRASMKQKGSKKIFWKNFMDARVNYIILPLARRLMPPDQAAMASGEGYLTDTLMHEISHGLGPAFARTAAGQNRYSRSHRAAIFGAGRGKGGRGRRSGREMAGRPRRVAKGKQQHESMHPTSREFFAPSVSESPKRMARPK